MKTRALAIFALLFLDACGGGGSGSSPTSTACVPQPPAPVAQETVNVVLYLPNGDPAASHELAMSYAGFNLTGCETLPPESYASTDSNGNAVLTFNVYGSGISYELVDVQDASGSPALTTATYQTVNGHQALEVPTVLLSPSAYETNPLYLVDH